MRKEPETYSEKYVHKSNRVIAIFAFVSLAFFVFCLMLIGSEKTEEVQTVEIDTSTADETKTTLQLSGMSEPYRWTVLSGTSAEGQ